MSGVPMNTAAIWMFSQSKDSLTTYADGTQVPSRTWVILLNGRPIGECTVHLHRRSGPDGRLDVSIGHTDIVYGPPPGGA